MVKKKLSYYLSSINDHFDNLSYNIFDQHFYFNCFFIGLPLEFYRLNFYQKLNNCVDQRHDMGAISIEES